MAQKTKKTTAQRIEKLMRDNRKLRAVIKQLTEISGRLIWRVADAEERLDAFGQRFDALSAAVTRSTDAFDNASASLKALTTGVTALLDGRHVPSSWSPFATGSMPSAFSPPALSDPFDNSEQVIDGSRQPTDVEAHNERVMESVAERLEADRQKQLAGHERLQLVAQRLQLRATEVLLKVLTWPEDERPADLHIHSLLSPEQVKRLTAEFEASAVQRSAELPERAKTSPHKQPEFSPSHRSGRGLVIDGAKRFSGWHRL